jgi:hypothetical protein
MDGQFFKTEFRELQGANTDIVQVPRAWRIAAKRARSARLQRRIAVQLIGIATLIAICLALGAAATACAFMIMEMWSD